MDHLNSKLAIDGGMPVRERMLPYGRQHLDEDDIQAVVEVLRSDWLTTGPAVAEFENSARLINRKSRRKHVEISTILSSEVRSIVMIRALASEDWWSRTLLKTTSAQASLFCDNSMSRDTCGINIESHEESVRLISGANRLISIPKR